MITGKLTEQSVRELLAALSDDGLKARIREAYGIENAS